MNLEAIEPLRSMGISLVGATESEAEFFLPLTGNTNDKGTLFAGSQYSGLVICGWYLTSQWATSQNLSEKVAIKDCHVTYPKAAVSDCRVIARFKQTPDQRPSGHWRALVEVSAIDEAGDVVSTLSGDYRVLVS
jgi:thioesterase domain-containing protein